jgi:hypothetical protein
MFGVMLILAILCMYCVELLMRIDEQATVETEVQQVEVAEQELVEGKLCP